MKIFFESWQTLYGFANSKTESFFSSFRFVSLKGRLSCVSFRFVNLKGWLSRVFPSFRRGGSVNVLTFIIDFYNNEILSESAHGSFSRKTYSILNGKRKALPCEARQRKF